MPKNKIAFNEQFLLYVYIYFTKKVALIEDLKNKGFDNIIMKELHNNDIEIKVLVTPETCSKAYEIINSHI